MSAAARLPGRFSGGADASDTPPVDPAHYRRAMGRFATGVTVVTTWIGTPGGATGSPGSGGHDLAMTANAIASVSIDPVLMMLAVERDARFHDAVLETGVWGVSVLAADSRGVAEWLSTQGRPLHGQLDRVPSFRGSATGVALLSGALALFECRTSAVHAGGDHSILLGEVLTVHLPEHAGGALVYYRGRYGTLK